MKTKLKKIILGIMIFSGSFFITIFLVVIHFEKVSIHNPVVLFSKRAVAELAAFGVNNFYDPFKKDKKLARLYPDKGADFSGHDYLSYPSQVERMIEEKLAGRLRIIQFINQPIVKGSFEFYYQPSDEKKLDTLRKAYGLEKLVAGSKDEYEKLIRLKNWVAGRWEFGKTTGVPYNFDALQILERALKGEKFFCSEYSTVFVQCALSLGFNARYVGLFKGHVVPEVWSNQFNKWIVLDPTFNIRYVDKSGIPLNSLELHEAWVKGNYSNIKVILDKPQPKKFSINDYEFRFLDYYENFSVRMRNDWFTNQYPHWYPLSNSIMNGLEWQDSFTKNSITVARESSKASDLYWSLDRTNIKLKLNEEFLGSQVSFDVIFDTFTPNFMTFVIKIDNKPWLSSNPDFIWDLHKGRNTLSVKSVNDFGVEGVESKIELELLN